MLRLTVSPLHPEHAVLVRAAEVLRSGGLVAFPTETVYGLGGDALSRDAVRRIFQAKGRPPTNPLIVHVADATLARAVVAWWPEDAERLARAFWPGPLTLVLPRGEGVPDEVTGGLDAVGVRVPAHPVALGLLQVARLPVAAPSANRYMQISPTTADHVIASLGDGVDLVLDSGPTRVGIESTVLDLTREVPTVLRPGGLSLAALRQVVPAVVLLEGDGGGAPLASPGLHPRHYAPRARLEVLPTAEALRARASELTTMGERVGVIIRTEPRQLEAAVIERLPDDAEGYGARLYAALHDLDAGGVSVALVEAPPGSEPWVAVRDRLRRAATDDPAR